MQYIIKFFVAEGDAILILVGIGLVAATMGAWLRRMRGRGGAIDVADYYSVRDSIMSPAERSFAGVLNYAMPLQTTICYKVRLGDILTTRRGLLGAVRKGAWNRINQKHVDFLLVNAQTFAPLAAIELDDESHGERDRIERDRFVDAVFKACGVKVLHFRASAAYSPNDVRRRIEAELFCHQAVQTDAPRGHTHLNILNATTNNLKTPKNT